MLERLQRQAPGFPSCYIMKKKKSLLGRFATVNGIRYQYQGKNRDGSYSFRNFETTELIAVNGEGAHEYLDKI